jgi:hypothetical protein
VRIARFVNASMPTISSTGGLNSVITSFTDRSQLSFARGVLAIALLWAPAMASADDAVSLTIKDHHFAPSDVTVPAGKRFRIEVSNGDNVPAEFESTDLHIEKIVVPGGTIKVFAGPLKPGTYKFFDDYHPEASGTITANEAKAGD